MSTDVETTSKGILRRSDTTTGEQLAGSISRASLPGSSPSISFAPLPPPTKRSKSHRRRALGVAGRSTILQQQNRLRRHHQDVENHENGYPRSRHHSDDDQPALQDDDDALMELARLVKDAGKKLWKSLSGRPNTQADSTVSKRGEDITTIDKVQKKSSPPASTQDDTESQDAAVIVIQQNALEPENQHHSRDGEADRPPSPISS